jgi:hypothetical protein
MIMTAGLAFASSPLAAQAQSQTVPFPVALTGTIAPAGGNYTDFLNPVLNASGQVAFFADTSVAGSGIFAGTPGSPLTTAALVGTAAPAGGNYTGFNNTPELNASGKVAFLATTSVSGNGIFAGTPGSPLTTVALVGTAAPAGGNYTGINTDPVFNASGKVAFLATTSVGTGIFAGTPGSPLTTAALQGTAAPAGGNYTSAFGIPVLNATGQVAIGAGTSVSGAGIFAGTPGSPLTTAALVGTAAPAGGNYTGFGGLEFNASGKVACIASTSASGQGIFAGTPGSPLILAALQGTAAPAGGNYTTFTNPVLNASGLVAFQATTSVAGSGIFTGTPGSPLSTAALTGTVAPNCGGATFNTFGNPVLNATGQVAFTCTLNSTTDTDHALFAGAPGSLVLVVRKGDVIDVNPTAGVDNRTVSAIGLFNGSGGQDGRGMSFNDSGLIVYELTFTDGSSGIFTSQIAPIPEPGMLLAFGAGVLGFGRYLRRRTI